jgi:hypothetical protein
MSLTCLIVAPGEVVTNAMIAIAGSIALTSAVAIPDHLLGQAQFADSLGDCSAHVAAVASINVQIFASA